ncbi:hypothetical protein I547_5663 [Mycobacterium kansasii 824]|uniref:Uncharacterized protein n=1 Tax=Mycobacterium kansasii TaxID=1768 RepID=A0A1V3XH53_MYCKA|nr:hypothetical protein I547_5663 [Mycobacterium kansasii 824]OOK77781.1 hypothetical protein BZL29_3928 [Mycobacterium kansasii]
MNDRPEPVTTLGPSAPTSTPVDLLTNDIPPEHRGPGSYMYEALKYRDQWQSRLLRTSAWSPLY